MIKQTTQTIPSTWNNQKKTIDIIRTHTHIYRAIQQTLGLEFNH